LHEDIIFKCKMSYSIPSRTIGLVLDVYVQSDMRKMHPLNDPRDIPNQNIEL
jgi:hypothetical protein